MYGSGIFNEASGSCDGDAGYGGFADKAPAAGENQVISIFSPGCQVCQIEVLLNEGLNKHEITTFILLASHFTNDVKKH
jgi:hypothetical protein